MADYNAFYKVKTKADFDREAEEFDLRRKLRMGSDPAAIKLADEIQRARSAGDTQRLNDLYMSAKLMDKGVITDPNGNPMAMGGYGDAVGSIEGAKALYKQNAQNMSDLSYKPQIAEGVAMKEAEVKGATAPQIAADTKSAELKAEKITNAQSNLPKVQDQAGQMKVLLDDIEASPGLSAVVGLPNPLQGRIPMIGNVTGSPAADFQAKLDQLGGKQFLEAFESLKGGGQITEVEGQKATNAIARMQTSQSEAEFKKALGELRGVVDQGLSRARNSAGAPVSQTLRVINPKTGEMLEIPEEDFPAARAEGYMKL